MKILQSLILKLLSLAVVAAGVVLFFRPLSELYAIAVFRIPPYDWLRYTVGVFVIVVGVFGLIPFSWRRKPRQISFPDPAGNLNIHLDAVEASLNRALAKRHDVKRIAVRMIKDAEPGKVRIKADCIPYKNPNTSARDLLSDLQAAIGRGAYNMLGEDVVTSIEVNARRIIPREVSPLIEEDLPPALREPARTAPAATESEHDAIGLVEPGPPSSEEAMAVEAIPEVGAEDASQTAGAENEYLYVPSRTEPEDETPFVSNTGDEDEPSGTAFLDLGDEEKEGPTS